MTLNEYFLHFTSVFISLLLRNGVNSAVFDFTLVCIQEKANLLAKQSVIACARLGGYHDNQENAPPDNPTIKKSLMSLLTPYLARKLANPNTSEVSCLFFLTTVS